MSLLVPAVPPDGSNARCLLAQQTTQLSEYEDDRSFQDPYRESNSDSGWTVQRNEHTKHNDIVEDGLSNGTYGGIYESLKLEKHDHVIPSHPQQAKRRPGYLLTDGSYYNPQTSSKAHRPLAFYQLDIILGLCKTVANIKHHRHAETLLQRFSLYLCTNSAHAFIWSQEFHHLQPCPWQLMTGNITEAVIQLSTKFPRLHHEANSVIIDYLKICQGLASRLSYSAHDVKLRHAEAEHTHQHHTAFALGSSLLGFLEAATLHAAFWSSAERHDLLSTLQNLVTDNFLVSLESAVSTIRNDTGEDAPSSSLKLFEETYSIMQQPLGNLAIKCAFTALVEHCAALMVVSEAALQSGGTLPALTSITSSSYCLPVSPTGSNLIAEISIQQLVDLEEGLDFAEIGSTWQRKCAQVLKSRSFTSYLCCIIVDESTADLDLFLSWLEKVIDDSQNVDEDLGCVALSCLTRLAKDSESIASSLCRSLPQMLIYRSLHVRVGQTAAECLLYVLKLLTPDAVITTIWGLANSLTGSRGEQKKVNGVNQNGADYEYGENSSAALSTTSLSEDCRTTSSLNRSLVVDAIITIASGLGDVKIVALAISMLIQKFSKVTRAVDLAIVIGTAKLGCVSAAAEFKTLLRFYSRLIHEGLVGRKDDILNAVHEALTFLAAHLKPGSPHQRYFSEYILQSLVAKGDTVQTEAVKRVEAEKVAEEMALLVHPLSVLVAKTASAENVDEVERFAFLQRDAWYNLVLHGFSPRSTIGKRHLHDLKVLARYSEPLVPVDRESSVESPIELNMVLKRGSSSHNTDRHRQELSELLPGLTDEISRLDHSETIFLKATHLVESLRAFSGDCTKIMGYFVEPRLQGTTLGHCVRAVAQNTIENSLRIVKDADDPSISALSLAHQLSTIFSSCCHRSPQVQEIAYACADKIIDQMPAVLCQRQSLFSLLDLMSVTWSGCLQSETTEYEWESQLSTTSGETVILSDDFGYRSYTLRTLHRRSKGWVMKAINNAPLDVKGLFQTYLSCNPEDESFGHVSMGRSYALEMGSVIPQTDHRLSAIGVSEIPINTASDFIAQYTGRQEYRFTDPLRLDNVDVESAFQLHEHLTKVVESGKAPSKSDHAVIDAVRWQSNLRVHKALVDLEVLIHSGEVIDIGSTREILRLAASLLCRLKSGEEREIIRLFVKIPFDVFSKQMIRLGLSLWMGVMQENEFLAPAIITEVVFNWNQTVQQKKGIFDNQYMRDVHSDPFFIKMEYAPSDKDAIDKQQHRLHDRLTPHFIILQFMSSHYMAQRLNGSFAELQSLSLIESSLVPLKDTPSHPLARELHFAIVLFSLKVLRYCSSISPEDQRLYKDKILAAALAWFQNPPRYSFGGNRLQTKAETHLLADVGNALQAIRNIGPENGKQADVRRQRQDLLQILLENEQTRLLVWLFPLDHNKRHFFASGQHSQPPGDSSLLGLIETAWNESPSLAINLNVRFQSEHIRRGVRQWVLKEPERAIHEPQAVQLMLGSSLPNDVGPQLHHLIKWAPVDPITSITYLLPAYGNHPLIVQYAMASLESHSVEDVTFFYVPQIVQSLRYDALGHIEQYIIKTAGFSQLFAHQIIWNIKANSYKDEDATDPDPMKPKLDKVMDRLTASFGGSDKDFYEREFAFFNEVTDVSGKLRPYLKASKPEKKQKIEEELRKIKIDPGVYLPSNPDGVVVNIDRTSGKPLQSHAKTPYMATFRIRKERPIDPENEPKPTSPTHTRKPTLDRPSSKTTASDGASTHRPGHQTYEIWQSAIFKVGDDCRQDILALQMIACFRGIFAHVGLPVYVFPYRVTATAPGCGVIDVLPRTISRDMLGREAVNGLYPWFISRFGTESSPAFQAARANFVKSLAAYSVISFLMQFKDRHNGNIMFDEDGHILHIDFGFCFDISPGGVRFERAPFKLTKEMLSVLGGSTETQAFRWFEELCVKAFLASRAYVDQLSSVVLCMLDSGLPCFKPVTIKHFRERFVLEKSEREAADFVRFLVKKSLDNKMTYVYDEFQLLTNGIPF